MAELRDEVHVVVQLHAPRTVKFDFLQCLAHHIVRLALRLLRRLDDRGLIQVAFVVYIELAESILQAKNVCLLELWVFSVGTVSSASVVFASPLGGAGAARPTFAA